MQGRNKMRGRQQDESVGARSKMSGVAIQGYEFKRDWIT